MAEGTEGSSSTITVTEEETASPTVCDKSRVENQCYLF